MLVDSYWHGNAIGIIVYSVIFLLTLMALDILSKIFNAKLTKNSILPFKYDIFSKIMDKNIGNFTEENTSKYISILTNDINIIEQNYYQNIFQIAKCSFSFIFALISLISINIYMTILILVFAWLPLLISKVFEDRNQKYRKFYSNAITDFMNKIKDIFSGFEVIKTFNIEERVKKDFKNYNENVENSKLKSNVFSGYIETLIDGSGFVLFLSYFILGAYSVITSRMTVGSLVAAVQLMNYVVNPLTRIFTLFTQMKSVDLIYEDIKKHLDFLTLDGQYREKFF